jgi:two-component system, sensor histidine kinase LadS
MKTSTITLYLFLVCSNCFGQISILENSTYRIFKEKQYTFAISDTSTFVQSFENIKLPKFSTLYLKFNLDTNTQKEASIYINCENQGYIKLFRIEGSDLNLIGQSGLTCPFRLRSIRDETAFIKLDLKESESLQYLLEVKNFNTDHQNPKFSIYTPVQYQAEKLHRKDSFINKYGQPIFLGVVVLILLITLFQCIMFRDKIYFIYFLYIIFILLRVAMNISLLVIEDYVPALNNVGFISRFSQTFSFLSIITYLFFIREFANTRQKVPKFDNFIKAQILFTAIYLFVELFAVVEKYTVPLFIQIHSGFELIETLLGIGTIIGLIKLYDKQNKYLIWGVVFLFLIAFVGQQSLLRFSTLSRFEQDVYLQILWGVAYLGEMIFFTLGLFNRSTLMKETIAKQADENTKLLEALNLSRKKDSAAQPETLNIATLRGTIVIQQADISRVEASGNYTVFYVHNQKQVMASHTLADFEDKLSTDSFLRVHKSHIVNLAFVAKYTKGDGGILTLQDGSEVPVSRSRKDELLKKLQAN